MLNQVFINIISDIKILSSKVALKEPSFPSVAAFLIYPLIPETVWILAFSNLATSIFELNIPLIKAEFLYILKGSPIILSFF